MPYRTLITAENAISLPKEVGDRLEQNPPALYLTKRRHIKEMFSEKFINELSKGYNTDILYVELVILTFDKEK
jgi:hypothetical protein